MAMQVARDGSSDVRGMDRYRGNVNGLVPVRIHRRGGWWRNVISVGNRKRLGRRLVRRGKNEEQELSLAWTVPEFGIDVGALQDSMFVVLQVRPILTILGQYSHQSVTRAE
jgi:hypothetical protein